MLEDTAEYRKFWENKIIATKGLYGFDDRQKEISKKKILFGIAPYEYFENKNRFDEALRERFEIFKENADKVDVTVYLYQGMISVSGKTETSSHQLEIFYDKVKSLAKETAVGLVSNMGEMADFKTTGDFVSSFTAYYGSSLPIVQEFIAQKKPVMIANYEL